MTFVLGRVSPVSWVTPAIIALNVWHKFGHQSLSCHIYERWRLLKSVHKNNGLYEHSLRKINAPTGFGGIEIKGCGWSFKVAASEPGCREHLDWHCISDASSLLPASLPFLVTPRWKVHLRPGVNNCKWWYLDWKQAWSCSGKLSKTLTIQRSPITF